MPKAASTPESEPTSEKPTNVIAALAAIMADLPGITKDERSEQGYNYRGIEAITRHVQHLCGKHGVVFVPRVVRRTTKEFTINSRPWTEDAAEVIYTVYGPGGIEDRIQVGPLVGLGRDNSDKGMNKAMTQAFKYALIQTLCIGDGKDDPDADVAREADARSATPDPGLVARHDLRQRITALPVEQRETIRKFCDVNRIPRVTTRMSDDELDVVIVELDRLAKAPETPPDAPQSAAAPSEGSSEPEAPAEAQSAVEAATQ